MAFGGITTKPLYKVGFSEGQAAMRKQVLTILEKKIMDPELPRTSERYQALIELTREISAEAR